MRSFGAYPFAEELTERVLESKAIEEILREALSKGQSHAQFSEAIQSLVDCTLGDMADEFRDARRARKQEVA